MTSWRSLVRAQLTPPEQKSCGVRYVYVINPQSDYGKARVGRPKIKPASTGRLRAPQCTHLPSGGSYHPRTDGTAGFSEDIAELCNGSTYDSDSYCLGSNPSSAAKKHAKACFFCSIRLQRVRSRSVQLKDAMSLESSCNLIYNQSELILTMRSTCT